MNIAANKNNWGFDVDRVIMELEPTYPWKVVFGLYEDSQSHAMDLAAFNGHYDIIVYLHESEYGGCTVAAMDLAASRAHTDVLRFLHKNRSESFTFGTMIDGVVPLSTWLATNQDDDENDIGR